MMKTRMFIVFIVLFVSYIGCGFFRWLLFSEKQKPTEAKEVDEEEETSTTWVVLIAGSKGFDNYRHKAHICDAYHTLRNGGLKDSNIIVFMYDDIAQSSKNRILNPMYGKYGTIIHRPGGNDVYKGVPKDYTGSDVTAANVLAVLEGVKSRLSGGSKKVVVRKSTDRIFVFYSGHGLPGMSDGTLIARDQVLTTLNRLDLNKGYISMIRETIHMRHSDGELLFGSHVAKSGAKDLKKDKLCLYHGYYPEFRR